MPAPGPWSCGPAPDLVFGVRGSGSRVRNIPIPSFQGPSFGFRHPPETGDFGRIWVLMCAVTLCGLRAAGAFGFSYLRESGAE